MKKRILSAALALLLFANLPLTDLAEEYDLADGSIQVTASDDGNQYVTQTNVVTNEKQTTTTVITQTDSGTTTTANTITITAEENQTAQVTLSGVNIDVSKTGGYDAATDTFKSGDAAVSIEGTGSVTIELDGMNTVGSGYLRAGVEKNNDGNLTITDANHNNGSLDAMGGDHGAGIGGGYQKDGSNITITNAEVNAQGGDYGAGIGGGEYGNGSDITISGSQINALGGRFGAGIGGGGDSDGSNIAISGGATKAAGGACGAGIGGGAFGNESNITVSDDAQVQAQGGNVFASFGAGAPIGNGGYNNVNYSPVTGEEATLDVSKLTAEGSIEYYAPSADMKTGTPQKIVGHVHDWDTGVVTTPATCTKKGVITYTCQAGNDFKKTEEIPLLPHSFEGQAYVSDGNATCEQDGTKTKYCIRYGTGGCTETHTVTDVGSRLNHSFEGQAYVSDGNATCEQDGTKTKYCVRYGTGGCTETHTVTDVGSKLAHTVVIDEAVAETYTSTGLTEGSHCSVCGKVLTKQKVISTIPPYRVMDQNGMSIRYKSQQSRNVLTIMVNEESAVLTGKLGGIRALKAQGVDKIIFVTKGATSTFAVADLLKQGTWGDTYYLIHDGSTVTFTFGEPSIDISGLLEKT
ncbi:MAG: hypothetical protein Q4B32_08230 [Clostridia bacterium]|nr:hypothetical protein [Clostridia bacterium]